MINQRFQNATRNQIVTVTRRGKLIHKTSDGEVDNELKLEYFVNQQTTQNPIKEFICTEARFLRNYVKL